MAVILVFAFCGCAEGSDASSQIPTVSKDDNSEASIEYAKQTRLLTDKNSYSGDDEIRFEIVPPSENDVVSYGYGCRIQFWDDASNEWKNSEKQFGYVESLLVSEGTASMSVVFSERCSEIADKYRLALEISVNSSEYAEVYSNEFSVNK